MSLFDFASWMRQTFPRSARKAKKADRKRKTQPLRLECLEDRVTPSVTVTRTSDHATFTTIQLAINDAGTVTGTILQVSAGTDAENVTISKSITLEGANFGVNPVTTTRGAETIVDGTFTGAPFDITANNVVLDGFTIEHGEGGANAGVATSSTVSGYNIENNIITDNTIGVYANCSAASTIQDNLFNGNNISGPSGGAGIYSDQGTASLTVNGNEFENHTLNNPILFAATSAVAHTNLTVTNNYLHDNAYGIYALSVSGGLFQGNTIRTTDPTYGDALTFGGSDTNIQVLNNDLSNNVGGLDIEDDGYFATTNSNFTVQLNSFANDSQFGVGVIDVSAFPPGTAIGYTGTLNASGNWWGTAVGLTPSDSTAPTAINGMVTSSGGPVTVGSFLNSGTNTATVGFTPATTTEMWVPKTAATSGLTHVDGNIQEGVNSAVSGMTVRVAADTYAENVTIDKYLKLIGAGSGSDASANTIIQSAADSTPVISVTGSGLDSSDRLLIQDVRITGATGSGNSGAGVYITGASTGHVELNGVDVASNGGYGIAVNTSGPVTDVAILNSTSEGNSDGFRMGTGQDLDGLTIDNSVFQNNQYGMEVYAASSGTSYLTDVSVSDTQFLNNTVKGAYFEKLNNATFINITVTGNGTGAASPAGFDLNLKYAAYSNISFDGATFTNNGTGATSGVGLTIKGRDDAPSYNSKPASVTAVGLTNVSITGSPIDLAIGNNVSGVTFSGVSLGGAGIGLVYYADAADTLDLADTSFDSALTTYITDQSTNNVTATSATFGGLTGATATLAQNFAIEDKIVHAIDVPGVGFVRVKAGNVFVTPNSFFSPTTTTPSIQRGVDAASVGDTVNVEAGTYAGNVTINKYLTLAGVPGNPTAVVIQPSSGDGITISSPATNVTVKDLEVTGATNGVNVSGVSGTVTLQDLTLTHDTTGFTASGNDTTLDLTDLTLTSNTTGGTISNVYKVNETPSSGSTPTTVTVSGSSFVNDLNQAISLSNILYFIVFGGSGSDTFNVTPSSYTTFTIHGNLPAPPVSPGDTLVVPAGGVLTDTNGPSGYSGTWTFGGDEPINFDGIETLKPTVPATTYAVADFPGVSKVAPNESSVWLYVDTGVAATTGWLQLPAPSGVTVDATLLAVDAKGDVAAEFPNHGVWRLLFGATFWTQLTTDDASLLALDGSGHVYADFAHYGLDEYVSGTGWMAVNPPSVPQSVDASLLAVDANGDVAAAFPGYGVWQILHAGAWQRLTPDAASLLAEGGNGNVYADLSGALSGIYYLASPTANTQLTPVHATLLTADASGDVFADFAGYGLNEYVSGTTWKSVQPPGVPPQGSHARDATLLTADANGNDVLAEFPGYGVWQYDADAVAFQQLTVSNPSMLARDSTGAVYADVSGQGVLKNASGDDNWQPLSSLAPPPPVTPSLMAVAANGDVAAEFTGYGVYLYTQANGWQRFTTSTASLLAIDASGDVYADLSGALSGIYELTGPTAHTQLTPDHANLLAVDGAGDVFVDLTLKGYGLLEHKSGAGSFIVLNPPGVPQSVDASLLAVDANGDVTASFNGYGVYLYTHASGWQPRLNSVAASQLAIDGGGDVFVQFAGYTGVYRYTSPTSFTQVAASNVSLLTDDLNGDVFADFATSGFYRYTTSFQFVPDTQGDASVLG